MSKLMMDIKVHSFHNAYFAVTEAIRYVGKIHERSVFINARATRCVESLEGTAKNPTTVKSPTNAIIGHVPVILYGCRTRTSVLVSVNGQ